jgi:hypothetical protein
VDRVDEELRGDTGFSLVLAEAEKPNTRNNDDGRIGIAELR